MQSKLVMASLCALLVITGLQSCGKRGDPYRPSEIPAKQTNSYCETNRKHNFVPMRTN